MPRPRFTIGSLEYPLDAWPLFLVAVNLVFNVVSGACFKISAASSDWRGFLTWQIAGNLAGFVTVLALTGLLRYIPLHVAYTVTTGLAVIGVQVLAAALLFREPITGGQWLGTALVVVGIAMIGGR